MLNWILSTLNWMLLATLETIAISGSATILTVAIVFSSSAANGAAGADGGKRAAVDDCSLVLGAGVGGGGAGSCVGAAPAGALMSMNCPYAGSSIQSIRPLFSS